MKTLRAILVGVVVLAVVVGVATFFLPAKVVTERSIEINRPASLIYAFVSDIDGFNQFSPWRAADPNSNITVTGDNGPGQKMTWDSKKMGKGSMTIAEVKPYESVAYDLDFSGAKAKAQFNLQPVGANTKVIWRMESQSGFNPVERVMNLVMKSFVTKDFDSGLAKLKILAEDLPNVELDGLAVSSAQLPARPFIYVPVEVSDADPAVAHSEILRGMNKANAVLILNDMAPSGPGVVQFTGKENGLIKAHAGFPIDKAPTLEEAAGLVGSAKVAFGEIPGGAMIRAPSPAKAGDKVFKQLEVYLKLMRLQKRGDFQQAYPAGPNGDTEIFVPIG